MSWKGRAQDGTGRKDVCFTVKRCLIFVKLTCLKMYVQIFVGKLATKPPLFGVRVFISSEGWIEKSLRPIRLNKTLPGTHCLNSDLLGGQGFGQNRSLWWKKLV